MKLQSNVNKVFHKRTIEWLEVSLVQGAEAALHDLKDSMLYAVVSCGLQYTAIDCLKISVPRGLYMPATVDIKSLLKTSKMLLLFQAQNKNIKPSRRCPLQL